MARFVRRNAREQRGDAVDERLAADEADVGIVLGLMRQMLARAEPDFQPDRARRERKQARRIDGPRRFQRQARLGQSRLDQALAVRAQLAPLATAVKTRTSRVARVGGKVTCAAAGGGQIIGR